ncbi:MAG: hypothetical protein ACFFBX_08415 [Promethearchaeota archaeon]
MLAIGALLTLLSGILSGIGHSIQRYGLDFLPELTPRTFFQRHIHLIIVLLTTPLWLLGGILSVSGAVLRWQAFSMGDVSLLKPLTNINILIVVIVGVVFLHEKIGRTEWIGISGLLAGVILLSIFTQERIIDTYNIPLYLLSTIICIILVSAFVFIGSKLDRSSREKELLFAISSGILYGIATIFLKAMTIEVIQILGYFNIFDPLALVTLITRISFWMYVISSVIAYFLLQCAYSHRRVSVAFPVNNSLSTLVPIIIAVFVFGDTLLILINGFVIFPFSYLPIIGIIAILISIILLRQFQGTITQTPLDTPPSVASSFEEEIKGVSHEAKHLQVSQTSLG